MIPWWWSWLLMIAGVGGLYLAGRRNRWGWAVGLGAQFLWLAYGVATSQWGFLISAIAYGAVYGTNLYRWTRERARSEVST